MHAGDARGFDDFVDLEIAEAGDVVGDRAGKQFNVLRQVTDVLTELQGIPLAQVEAVDLDGSGRHRPHADNPAHKARLAGGARADDAQGCSRLQGEGHAMDHCAGSSRRDDAGRLRGKLALWSGERHP